MSDHPDKLITNPAVARLFNVAPRTIFNWVVRPELNFPRPLIIGARRYFSEAQILAWKASRVMGAAPVSPAPVPPNPAFAIIGPIPPRMTGRRIEAMQSEQAKQSKVDRRGASEVEVVDG
jgi:predicted DNA-binding transcriptional regulator AlpA